MEINTVEQPVAQDIEVKAVDEAIENTEVKDDGEAKAADKSDDVVFPKKAINALSRRDKQIGKLRAQLQQQQAELAKFQAQQQPSPKRDAFDDAPNEDNYETYGEYMQAVMDYKLEQKLSQSKQQEQESQKSAQLEAWKQEKKSSVDEAIVGYLQKIPDFQQTMAEYLDVLDDMPSHIEEVFYHAEDPALASYILAKEGKLEAVFSMNPYQAMAEIARAQERGNAYLSRKVTNAPTPLSSAKGQTVGRKSLDDMSWDELKKNYLNK